MLVISSRSILRFSASIFKMVIQEELRITSSVALSQVQVQFTPGQCSNLRVRLRLLGVIQFKLLRGKILVYFGLKSSDYAAKKNRILRVKIFSLKSSNYLVKKNRILRVKIFSLKSSDYLVKKNRILRVKIFRLKISDYLG